MVTFKGKFAVLYAAMVMLAELDRPAGGGRKAQRAANMVTGTVPPADVPAAPVGDSGATGETAAVAAGESATAPAGTLEDPRILVSDDGDRAVGDFGDVRIIAERLEFGGAQNVPQGKLADVSLEFGSGLLAGLTHIGGGFWAQAKNGALSAWAGLPQRSYGPYGKATMDIWLDGADMAAKRDGGRRAVAAERADVNRVKAAIVQVSLALLGGPDGVKAEVLRRQAIAAGQPVTGGAARSKDRPVVNDGSLRMTL